MTTKTKTTKKTTTTEIPLADRSEGMPLINIGDEDGTSPSFYRTDGRRHLAVVTVMPDGTRFAWDMCGTCTRGIRGCSCPRGATPPGTVAWMRDRTRAWMTGATTADTAGARKATHTGRTDDEPTRPVPTTQPTTNGRVRGNGTAKRGTRSGTKTAPAIEQPFEPAPDMPDVGDTTAIDQAAAQEAEKIRASSGDGGGTRKVAVKRPKIRRTS